MKKKWDVGDVKFVGHLFHLKVITLKLYSINCLLSAGDVIR